MSYFQLSDYAIPGENLWMRLKWDKSYSIDQLAYYNFVTDGIEFLEFKPGEVNHSSFGDTRAAFLATDDLTATLRPGEIISMAFGPIPEPPAGKSARYIISCTGSYKTETLGITTSADNPPEPSLEQNAPNPFNEGTTITYALSQDGPVRLEVYNILGQRVRMLYDGFQSAGRHSIHWDGKDHNGATLASGMYFYRLVAGDHTESKKMVLMK